MKQKRPATLAAQALGWTDETTKAVVPPVHVATTYIRDPDNQYRSGYSYGRDTNPGFRLPEALLAALEGGTACLTFSSGMAAAMAVFLALRPGDHVIAPRVMYWGLRNWLQSFAREWGLSIEFVDASANDAIAEAIRPGQTKLIWIETPANPTWCITDIAAAAELAHRAGARLAIDSTAATPILTRPIELGADLVMHSATKYLNGHSDVPRRRPGDGGTGRTVGAYQCKQDQPWRDPRLVRSVAAAARHAYASAAGRTLLSFRSEDRGAFCGSPPRCRCAVSRTPQPSRTRGSGSANAGGLWRNAQHPGSWGWRWGNRRRRAGPALETRHVARRGREPD